MEEDSSAADRGVTTGKACLVSGYRAVLILKRSFFGLAWALAGVRASVGQVAQDLKTTPWTRVRVRSHRSLVGIEMREGPRGGMSRRFLLPK